MWKFQIRKNEIKDNNEKICSRFSDTVSNEIDFTPYGLQIDQPPAWELKLQFQVSNRSNRASFRSLLPFISIFDPECYRIELSGASFSPLARRRIFKFFRFWRNELYQRHLWRISLRWTHASTAKRRRYYYSYLNCKSFPKLSLTPKLSQFEISIDAILLIQNWLIYSDSLGVNWSKNKFPTLSAPTFNLMIWKRRSNLTIFQPLRYSRTFPENWKSRNSDLEVFKCCSCGIFDPFDFLQMF